MARWWLHGTMAGYRLELDAERRAERQMYQLQEACAGHGDSGTAAFERMMKPRVEEFVREMRAALASRAIG